MGEELAEHSGAVVHAQARGVSAALELLGARRAFAEVLRDGGGPHLDLQHLRQLHSTALSRRFWQQKPIGDPLFHFLRHFMPLSSKQNNTTPTLARFLKKIDEKISKWKFPSSKKKKKKEEEEEEENVK